MISKHFMAHNEACGQLNWGTVIELEGWFCPSPFGELIYWTPGELTHQLLLIEVARLIGG